MKWNAKNSLTPRFQILLWNIQEPVYYSIVVFWWKLSEIFPINVFLDHYVFVSDSSFRTLNAKCKLTSKMETLVFVFAVPLK